MNGIFSHKLTYAEKKANDDEYGRAFIDSVDVYSSNHSLSSFMIEKDNMVKNYDFFNGRINLNDFLPYNYETEEETIGKIQHYDIVVSKIKALIGEWAKRPFDYSAVAINQEAYDERLEEKKKLLEQYWTKKLQDIAAKNSGQEQTEEENKMDLTTIEKYMRTFKIAGEIEANYFLEYYNRKLQIEQSIIEGFEDTLKVSKAAHYIGIRNNLPVIELLNPLYLNYHRSPDNKHIENAEWASYEYRLTASDIYDRWGDDPKIQKHLEKLVGYSAYASASLYKANEFYRPDDEFYEYKTKSKAYNRDTWDSSGNWQNYLYRLLHVEWNSLAKVGFLKRKDATTGEIIEYIVDDTYTLKKEFGDISIEWLWKREIWEGYKLGTGPDAFYFGIDRKDVQFNNIYNLNDVKLGYHGIILNSRNTEPVSMIDRGMPYQYLFIVVHLQLERLLASDIGRVMMADVNIIPDQYTPEQWMYLLKEFKIAFVDSASPKAKRANFNNMGTADLSATANAISQRIQLLQYISQRCNEVMGITKQREGMFSPNTNVTDNQAAINQSANTTEMDFTQYDQYIERVLTSFLECAKIAHKTNPRKINAYIKGSILPIDSDRLLMYDYDVFITNRSRHKKILDMLEQLTMPMIQNGYNISDILNILVNENSYSKSIEDLKELEKKKELLIQQQQEHEQQINQERIKGEAEKQKQLLDNNIQLEQLKIDADIQLKKMDIDLQYALKDFDNKTKEFTNLSKEKQTEMLTISEKEKANNKRQTDLDKAYLQKEILQQQVENEKREIEFKLKKFTESLKKKPK